MELQITGKTKIMFILADPVEYIRGSVIITRLMREAGVDIAVSPLHVKPDDLEQAVKAMRVFHNVPGFGITIPHKIAVARFLDELTPQATLVGSVNFVRRNADGSLVGDNLDGIGFVDGLARSGISVQGKRVLQLGAGGAGRSTAFSMAQAGAAVLGISNRTRAKADDLAKAIRLACPACKAEAAEADPRGYDVVVNTTSLGMGGSETIGLDPALLASEMAVADIIMSPEMTPLLIAAQNRGCRLGLGKYMLEAQVKRVQQFFGL